MKKVIGTILCVIAIALIFGIIVVHKPETTAGKIQDWGVVGVLLIIGIALSRGKKTPKDSDKK